MYNASHIKNQNLLIQELMSPQTTTNPNQNSGY